MIDPRVLWQEQDRDHAAPPASELRRMSLEGQQGFLRGVRWWTLFPLVPGAVVILMEQLRQGLLSEIESIRRAYERRR